MVAVREISFRGNLTMNLGPKSQKTHLTLPSPPSEGGEGESTAGSYSQFILERKRTSHEPGPGDPPRGTWQAFSRRRLRGAAGGQGSIRDSRSSSLRRPGERFSALQR